MAENYFTELNKVSIAGKVEEKNGLKYLSWAYAWEVVKQHHPDATYTIYENTLPNGYIVNYFTDGRTAWVKTGLTINGIEHIEELPVMDYKNRSMPLDSITSFDVNKTIQRSLTKAAARHGVGLALYSGEDLPEETEAPKAPAKPAPKTKGPAAAKASTTTASTTAEGTAPALSDLIKEIGNIIKGGFDMGAYHNIVKEVTGSDEFRVNKATQDQYELVLAIRQKLTASK